MQTISRTAVAFHLITSNNLHATMDVVSEKKDALVAVALAAFGMMILIFSTSAHEYGLPLPRNTQLIWSATRLFPAASWMSIAALLILFRSKVFWTSAAVAFMATLIVGCVTAALMAPADANPVAVMTSVSYYAIVSALLCLTIRNPYVAGLSGVSFLLLQVLTDVAAHLASGVLQLAI